MKILASGRLNSESNCQSGDKMGQYQVICQSTKSVRLITADQDDMFIAAIHGLVPTVDAGTVWFVTISINDSPVEFMINTRANIGIMYDSTFRAPARKPSLRPEKKFPIGAQMPTSRCLWSAHWRS